MGGRAAEKRNLKSDSRQRIDREQAESRLKRTKTVSRGSATHLLSHSRSPLPSVLSNKTRVASNFIVHRYAPEVKVLVLVPTLYLLHNIS